MNKNPNFIATAIDIWNSINDPILPQDLIRVTSSVSSDNDVMALGTPSNSSPSDIIGEGNPELAQGWDMIMGDIQLDEHGSGVDLINDDNDFKEWIAKNLIWIYGNDAKWVLDCGPFTITTLKTPNLLCIGKEISGYCSLDFPFDENPNFATGPLESQMVLDLIYCFGKNDEFTDTFFTNVTKSLKQDGYFIGSMVDKTIEEFKAFVKQAHQYGLVFLETNSLPFEKLWEIYDAQSSGNPKTTDGHVFIFQKETGKEVDEKQCKAIFTKLCKKTKQKKN